MNDKHLNILKTIYPDTKDPKIVVLENFENDLPLWIHSSIKINVVSFDGDFKIYFVQLTQKLAFDQVIYIYKKLSEKLKGQIVIIADNLPAKYRGLLVRSRIPYVYKDQNIYLPDLGVHFNNAKKHFAAKPEAEQKEIPLTPFALKLAAGFITEQLPEEFTLKGLLKLLHKKKTKVSVAKLSTTLNLLVEYKIIQAHGSGPQKTFSTFLKQEMFDVLNELRLTPLFKLFEFSHCPFDMEKSCFAGETALANYSLLGDPPVCVIAVTAKEHREKTLSVGQGEAKETPCHVQVWKEDPLLFSKDRNLNPIELYFSLKDEPDERVQICLDEMLKEISIKRESE